MASPQEAPEDGPIVSPHPTEERALRVMVIAGSQRRHNSCPGLDSKARALMLRMAAALPPAWQIDTEDLGNQHGKPKIQACNACVSSSMALCVWPCNCYGPRSTTQPDLMWDLDLYGRLARADAWAFSVSFLSIRSGRGLPPAAQTRRSNISLKLVVGPYQLVGPMKAQASARARRP